MQLLEEPEDLTFDNLVLFSTGQSRVKQLDPDRVKPKFGLEEPSNFGGRELHAFTLQISDQHTKARAEFSYPLSRSPLQVLVEHVAQLTLLVQ